MCLFSGLENLFHLTLRKKYELLVDMEDFDGNQVFARYSSFSIDPESYGYTLHVSGFIDGGAGELVVVQVVLCFSLFVSTSSLFKVSIDRIMTSVRKFMKKSFFIKLYLISQIHPWSKVRGDLTLLSTTCLPDVSQSHSSISQKGFF